jgi:hypothetical protein
MMNLQERLPSGEILNRDVFYRVTMKTKGGKKLYLCENSWYGKNAEKINCKWEFTKANALWFETKREAERFCKEYFKNFDNYEIEDFIYVY